MNVDGSGAETHQTPEAAQGHNSCSSSPTAEAFGLELERLEPEVHREVVAPLDGQAAPSDGGHLDNESNFSTEVPSFLNHSDDWLA